MGSDKALVVEASPSDRVLDVKLKIQELEGTPVNLQRLIFCGRPLQNESILESYGVVNGSVVHYVSEKKRSMQLFIRQMTGTDFVVRCEENDMVEDLKRKIETIDGTDFDSMRLIYGSKQLVDSFDLRSYNIKDGSTILMMHRLVGGFSVNIRISDGRSLVVGLFDTIRELKHNICKKSGIPVSMQIVSFDGKVLEDECRREDYNIEAGYTLDLYVLRGDKPGSSNDFVDATVKKRNVTETETSSFIQFPKLKNASSTTGQDLEVALCSLLFLRGLRLCSTFFLGTNHANAGIFDDAVFIYRRSSVSPLRMLLIQTKHKLNFPVTYNTLLGSGNKNDFSLSKYQTSHNNIDPSWRSFSINEETVTRVKYFMYTNAPLELKEGIGASDESDDVSDFLLTSGRAHKFSLSDVEDAFKQENKKAAESFLEDFTFCYRQMDHKTSNDFIEEEIRLILKTGPEDTSKIRAQFTALIKQWWDKRNEAEFQTRTSPIWRTIIKERLENMNSETAKLAEKHRLTFKQDSVQDLQNAVLSSKSLYLRVNSLAEVTMVRLKIYQTLEMSLILSTLSMTEDDLDQAFALWNTDFCSVLVVVNVSFRNGLESKLLKKLSMLNSRKCLLLVSTAEADESVWTKGSTGVCWEDLDAVTQAYILNTLVTFQDSQAIVSDLIGTRGDILSPEQILLLSERSEDIILGKSALRDKVVCYQKRFLTRMTCLNESFFQFIKHHRATCAFDVIPEGEDGRRLEGITLVDYETFNTHRMMPKKGSEKIYKLRLINDEFIYEDCVGEGALNLMRKHVSNHVTEIIENIWEVEEKRIVVNGYPGIGKSSFVTDMCMRSLKRRPFEWAVRVNIRDHRSFLKELKREGLDASKVATILTTMYLGEERSRCTLEETLLLHALNEKGNVNLFVDAVDEGCPEFEETCVELLRAIDSKVRYRKLLVTTRPVTCQEVEDTLNVLAFEVPGFTPAQLTRFLQEYCAYKGFSRSPSDIAKMVTLAGKCMRVPLLARMAAEEGIVDSFLRTELFRIFVEKETEKFLTEKLRVRPTELGYKENFSNQKQSQNEKFMSLAVNNLIDSSDLLTLKLDTSDFIKELKNSKSDLVMCTGEKVEFVHRSFDEFFLGMWLSRHWPEKGVSELCKKLLFRENFEFVRESFESFIVQNHELHTAVARGNSDAAGNILRVKGMGFARHSRDGGKRNVLHVAATATKGDRMLWNLLLEYGALVDDTNDVLGWTPLQYALMTSNWNFSEFILEKGASGCMVTVLDDDDCACRVLAKSCSEGRVQLTKLVLQKRPELLRNVLQEDGNTALHLAVRSGNIDLVIYLLDLEATVTAVNHSGRHAVSEAAFYGHTHILRLFHERNKPMLVGISTPLHCAAIKGHMEALEFVLNEVKLNVDLEEVAEGNTAFQEAAESGSVEAMKRLFIAGADVKHKNSYGSTALHGACRKSRVDAVKFLLQNGALVNARDEYGKTPLALAKVPEIQTAVREFGGYT